MLSWALAKFSLAFFRLTHKQLMMLDINNRTTKTTPEVPIIIDCRSLKDEKKLHYSSHKKNDSPSFQLKLHLVLYLMASKNIYK